jgi:uncharacterized cupredoxin-like copper-binding protein
VALSAVVVLLAGASTLVIAAARGGFDTGRGHFRSAPTSCTVPNLSGAVVDVTLTNMGGPMMGGGSVTGGMMRLSTSASSATSGTVSFVATNVGSVNHELLVLPLPEGQIVGTRVIRDDGTVDELGSLGEASKTCGAGTGDGIAPGTSSWVTLTLAPGRYELVCNLPGHYAAGMYAQITVR